MVKKYATTLFASTVHNHSVRIIISYYSTIRLEREQILGMFGLCHCPQETIQEKFVLNSIWLDYGSMVIRLQRLPMVICKNTFLSILHNILISLECLLSFHKGVFTQSYWVQRANQRLKNFLPLETSNHLQQIMLLTKRCQTPYFHVRCVLLSTVRQIYRLFLFDVNATSSLFRSVVFCARRFFASSGEIYNDASVREFMLWLLDPSVAVLYKHIYQFRAVSWYAKEFAKPIYNSSGSVNPLKSLLYAAHHHYSLSSYLGLDWYTCLKLRFDFVAWKDYQNLVQYFQDLETDKLFAYENYASMSPFTGTYDFNVLKTRSIFQRQVQNANMDFTDNIKHRAVVDSYKN